MRKYYNAIDFEAFRKTIWHKMKENIHRDIDILVL